MPFILTALFLDSIFQWMSYLWWAWLFLVAWWLYSWVQEKLGFAPIAALAIAAILIYYLVIEHPIIGSIGYLGSVIVFGGILFLLPYFTGPMLWFFRRRR